MLIFIKNSYHLRLSIILKFIHYFLISIRECLIPNFTILHLIKYFLVVQTQKCYRSKTRLFFLQNSFYFYLIFRILKSLKFIDSFQNELHHFPINNCGLTFLFEIIPISRVKFLLLNNSPFCQHQFWKFRHL